MSIDFTITHIPTVRVAQARHLEPEGTDFYGVADFAVVAGPALDAALQAASIERTGPVFLHYEEREDGTLTPIIAMPIGDQPVPEDAAFEVAELPPIEAVVTIHSGAGDHDTIGPLYGQMARYAEGHRYAVEGPGRDHLVSYDGGEMVFELQLPVTREAAP